MTDTAPTLPVRRKRRPTDVPRDTDPIEQIIAWLQQAAPDQAAQWISTNYTQLPPAALQQVYAVAVATPAIKAHVEQFDRVATANKLAGAYLAHQQATTRTWTQGPGSGVATAPAAPGASRTPTAASELGAATGQAVPRTTEPANPVTAGPRGAAAQLGAATGAATGAQTRGPWSAEQTAQVLFGAGFRGEDLVMMTAIAGRESHHDPTAHRTDSPGAHTGDYGLAQINWVHYPVLKIILGLNSIDDLLDPVVNAKAAFWLYQHNRFNDWKASEMGFDANGNPLHGVDLVGARAAVNNAQANGILTTPYTPGTSLPATMTRTSAPGAAGGFDPRFGDALSKLLAASGGKVWIGEGLRNAVAQEKMFRARYTPDPNGEVTWNGQRWHHTSGAAAAPPGSSMHEIGLAADLKGDMAWLAAHAGEFGLHTFADVNHEPWHVQLNSLANSRRDYEASNQFQPYQPQGMAADAGLNAALGGVQLSGAGDALAPGADAATTEAWVRSHYAYMAGFLDIPEVRDVLIQSAQQNLSRDEMQGLLSQTHWWQTTAQAQRDWIALTSEDPAQAQAKIAATTAQIRDKTRTLGLRLSDEQINQLALDANTFGWTDPNDPQRIDAILAKVDWSGATAPVGGTLNVSVAQLKANAAQFMIGISDETAQDYATRIASGELDPAGVQTIFATQAKARFSYLAPLIDQGIAPADYFAPARDTIAAELELGRNQVDLMDPKWMKLLEVNDPKLGVRGATLNEARLAARRDPAWARTKNASDMAASLGSQLQAAFGRQ